MFNKNNILLKSAYFFLCGMSACKREPTKYPNILNNLSKKIHTPEKVNIRNSDVINANAIQI